MFRGGKAKAADYVAAFEHAKDNTTENNDVDANYKPVTVSFYDIATDL